MPNPTLQENIIALLGLEALPDEKKVVLLDKMSTLVQKRVTARILEQLSAEEQKAFVDASINGDEDSVQSLLQKKNIDMMALVADEAVKLKEEMKAVVEGLGV